MRFMGKTRLGFWTGPWLIAFVLAGHWVIAAPPPAGPPDELDPPPREGARHSDPALDAKDSSHPAFMLLDELVRDALHSNPSIRAARSRWAASTKRPSQVSTLPNPEVGFSSMTSGNALPYSTLGMGPVDWASFMFTQKIPWPGKLALEGEMAETESARQARDYQAVTLEIIREVKEAFFQIHTLDRSREILLKYRDLLDRFARISESRYGVGEGLMQDPLRAQVEISLILERLELLDVERESLEARLNALLNRPMDAPVGSLPAIDDSTIELPFSLDKLYLLARERNPAIAAGRLDIQQASLRLERSRKDFLPDFTVSAGYFLRGGEFRNMYEYRVGIELPLYWRRKERMAVEESVENLQGSRHEYERKLQDVAYRIKDSYIAARTSQRLLELYRGGVIPQATAALDSSISSYHVGSLDFLTLSTNALTILNYELQVQKELGDYYRSLVRLEQQLGMNLVGTVSPSPSGVRQP